MDQKRLILAIAISLAIMLGFQFLLPKPQPDPAKPVATAQQGGTAKPAAGTVVTADGTPAAASIPRNVPRVKIDAARVQGSISLLGARLDDLVLKDYRETIEKDAKLVRLLEPRGEAQPYYVQYGWTAAPDSKVKLPDSDTVWSASAEAVKSGAPVTLSWDNGEGLTFQLVVAVDDNFMFGVDQKVINRGTTPVSLFPFARIRRDYKPTTEGFYILHEGMLGVLDGKLQEMKYSDAKSEGEKKNGAAYVATATGGWAGFTDKYWLVTLIPEQAERLTSTFRYINEGGQEHFQVDFLAADAVTTAPGAATTRSGHLFAGAKEVHLLDRYETAFKLPNFDKAVDFGWFYFMTKPMFYAIDWFNGMLGNFGLAILAFTLCVKLVFFPLANKSYRSMSRMRLLAPKMQQVRERFKDDPQKMQGEIMQLYKAEKVNPASGCLPMVIQIPVFFSLYKVIFVTIEMRHAPFFGWIHDLSAIDPTNLFNAFGLIPFDPTTLPMIGSFLHLGVWPVIMGLTMFFQQKLNPAPPDPMQARMFQFMPLIFTFMLASFPAGLVIYWSWNNLLSIGQQWLIMRSTTLPNPKLAKV